MGIPHFVQRHLVVRHHVLVPLLEHLHLLVRHAGIGCVGRVLVRRQPARARRLLRRPHAARRRVLRRGVPRQRPRGVGQHAAIPLHLPLQPRLHHGLLRAAAQLQLLPQQPEHTVAVDARVQRPRLRRLVLPCLLPARRPRAQDAEPAGILLADGRLEVVPSLVLRVVEDAYARVDLADDLLRVGVDVFAVSVGEVSLRLSRPEVCPAGLRCG